jgi:hypothetical protein
MIEDATHWVQHEAAERVNQLIINHISTKPEIAESTVSWQKTGLIKNVGDGGIVFIRDRILVFYHEGCLLLNTRTSF